MLLWLLPCFMFPSVIFGAVIEVTAGGTVSDLATYKFSDTSGAQVSTLTTTGTDDKITASGALASTEFVVHGGGPADSQLTISSCSAVNTFNTYDCTRAYDGDGSTGWTTTSGTSGSITVTLSNAATITRFEILQDGAFAASHAAGRVIIEYFTGSDGGGTRLWRGHHDFLNYATWTPLVENEEFWIFPRVQGVLSIKLTLTGNHPSAGNDPNHIAQSHSSLVTGGYGGSQYRVHYRGIKEMKVYGY